MLTHYVTLFHFDDMFWTKRPSSGQVKFQLVTEVKVIIHPTINEKCVRQHKI
jgi:hypothetical protein